jgi:hypothetical protein
LFSCFAFLFSLKYEKREAFVETAAANKSEYKNDLLKQKSDSERIYFLFVL